MNAHCTRNHNNVGKSYYYCWAEKMRDTWATAVLILNYASKWMSSNTRCDDALCVQYSRWTCWINIYFSTNKTNGATQTEHTMHARTQHTRTHKIRTNNQTSLEEKQQKKQFENFLSRVPLALLCDIYKLINC